MPELILLVLLFLPMGRASAQAASAPQDGLKNIALCFPIRTDQRGLSQFFSQEPDEKLSWRLIEETLATPQSLANGGPYPEATSLEKLMEESLRANTEIGHIIPIGIDTLKTLHPEEHDTAIFQAAALQNVDAVMFILYTIIDNNMQFGVLLLTKTGESATYFSGACSIFNLSEATKEAVTIFIAQKIVAPAPSQSSANFLSSEQGVSTAALKLPVIEPWIDKPKYEQASSRLKFSIGGVAIGLSLSMVSLGLWETYQEAAYRNTAFENAVTASGIATGACAAATAAFLTSAIWNAVIMLQASR